MEQKRGWLQKMDGRWMVDGSMDGRWMVDGSMDGRWIERVAVGLDCLVPMPIGSSGLDRTRSSTDRAVGLDCLVPMPITVIVVSMDRQYVLLVLELDRTRNSRV